MPGERRTSWETWSPVAACLALGAVLWAISAGHAPHRLGPVAAFLAIWAAAAVAATIAKLATRRRAARLQGAAVPRGVRLEQPIWIKLDGLGEFATLAAPIGAVAALVGFPGVGLGIFLTFAVIGGAMNFWPSLVFAPALTFEPAGLRVHQRGIAFLVPWGSILDVTTQKTPGKWYTNIRVADPTPIIASVTPDSPRNRSMVWTALQLGAPRGRAFPLWDWTGGLDTATLRRALRAAIGEGAASIN
jgi:hypothetical protein